MQISFSPDAKANLAGLALFGSVFAAGLLIGLLGLIGLAISAAAVIGFLVALSLDNL